MSYQVLARKYRPADFTELEGQEHVLQALVNALDNERLHHAYLFTGTRGVGKTTIARILARCLNCETGVTSRPCGECNTCREISEGRSVDLIEVDAASRTGVDDMRELLDNVQYMPTVSRFKIYLIDEVHMLSRSSFNAMLKTLEEPPEHVKFLFATPDPKKLPITVLSRCLQFNLKNLTPEQIVVHLGNVLNTESIAFDDAALWHLGRAADGSMRDALSLTDQAISFGNNEVREEPVRAMLGSIDHHEVYDLLDAIMTEDGSRLLQKVAALSEFAPDYAALLDDLMSVLHRVAVAQAVPDALDNSHGDRELVLAAASQVSPEQVQLMYQIALIGQRDLSLAPLPRTGFEMVLLRMMSFLPVDQADGSDDPVSASSIPASGSAPVPAGTAGSAQTAPVTAGAPAAAGAKRGGSPIAQLLSAINGDATSADADEDDSAQKKTELKAVPEKTPVSVEPPASVRSSEAGVSAPVADSTEVVEASESPQGSKVSEVTDAPLAASDATAPTPGALSSVMSSDESRTGQDAVDPGPVAEETVAETRTEKTAEKDAENKTENKADKKPEPKQDTHPESPPEPHIAKELPSAEMPELLAWNWPEILAALKLSGVTRTLAANCLLESAGQDHCQLKLNEHHASLWNASHEQRIAAALSEGYGRPVRVSIQVGDIESETPAQLSEREREESHAQAVADIESDEGVQQLIERFNGRLDPDSISPAGSQGG